MSGSDNYESVAQSASNDVAKFDDPKKGVLGHFQHVLHSTPALVPLIVLVVSIIIFGLHIGSNFFSTYAFTTILLQVQIVGFLAAAQSLVILTAGIDLSVGAIAVFTSVVMGQFTFRYGVPAPISILVGMAVGTAIGAVSGWLVSRVKLPPFIVTLGMWQIVLAANYLFSQNETIRSQDIETNAPFLQFLGTSFNVAGIRLTLGIVLMIALVAILAYCLRSTAWGRHVYAVGDDAESAKLAGVNVHRILMTVYMLVGLISAVAGWAMIGRIGSVTPSASTGVMGNIHSITAVVIGGISLFGGRGSIVGALFGAIIVGVFELGLRMAGADVQWTYLLIGMLIIGAVSVDQWIRKVAA